MWDVDGRGMSKIEDADLANALLDKVNAFNGTTAIQSAIAVVIFAAIPKGAAVFFCFLAGLYFLQGKVPLDI